MLEREGLSVHARAEAVSTSLSARALQVARCRLRVAGCALQPILLVERGAYVIEDQ